MAELEKLGYLDHPHTSAGRMPTDEGYRVFVDSLMSHEPLAAARGRGHRIRAAPAGRLAGPGHGAGLAAPLAPVPATSGFVLVPDTSRTAFRHIDLVRLPHPRILAVMVSRTGLVTHRVLEVEDDLSQEHLQACANYLNANFGGLSLGAIRERLLELMREEKALYDSLLQERRLGRQPRLRRGGRRGERVPGRSLEHAGPARVRGPGPDAVACSRPSRRRAVW